MKLYKTNRQKLSGTSFSEIEHEAIKIFKSIKARTRRTPYIRSKYFKKEKVFLNLFWSHIYQKKQKDRVRRLKFYDCAIDLIKNSATDPVSRENFLQNNELLHRFYGITKYNEIFIVQIKENKRTRRKDLISIYPE